MNEENFLNIVLQGAARGSFADGYESGRSWEIVAQVAISTSLRNVYGIEECRELKYPNSKESCDFGFAIDGKSYAIELKVETRNGKFSGSSLRHAVASDVNKLHDFAADYKWFVVIVRSDREKDRLRDVGLRGDSWIMGEKSGFLIALCNIDTMPYGLPWSRFDNATLNADHKFLRN